MDSVRQQAQPITINATAGTVSGPVNPVVINLNGGGWIVTCDGAVATWTVTGTSHRHDGASDRRVGGQLSDGHAMRDDRSAGSSDDGCDRIVSG